MAASMTDKITRARNGARPTATTATGTRAVAGTVLTCGSLTGWPTASAVHFVTYKIDTSSEVIAGTQCDWKGIVSGSTITNLALQDGTDAGNAIGDVVEMLPTAAWEEDLAEGLEVSLNRDGTLKDQTNLGLTTPKITTSINDSSGNEVIKTPATASAVNEITVTNAATTNSPTISATGGDTNIDLKLLGKGTGIVDFATNSHVIAYTEATAGVNTTSGTYSDITGATMTLTTPANCTRLLLRAELTVSSDSATATGSVAITDSGNTVQVERTIITGQANAGALQTLSISRRITVTASTAYTFKLRFKTSGGTFVVNQGSSATTPFEIWAERA